MKLILYASLLLAAATARAQTTRSVQSLRLWPEIQGEIALRNGDYLLLGLRGERTTNDDERAIRHLGFDAGQVRVGYEHFWSARWSWGATTRFNGGGGQLQASTISGETLTPELLLRHRSPIFGGITFGQRLGVERIFPTSSHVGGAGPGSQTWGRLRLDLEKLLPLTADAAGLALRPRLSYEAATHLRFQKNSDDLEERTIQYTSLRAEVGVRLSPSIDFTPWFAYQTGYYAPIAQYDVNGNQLHGKFFDKYNNVYPTLGFDLRYTILPGGKQLERQQLPTQH